MLFNDPLQSNIIQLYNPDFMMSPDRKGLINIFGRGESYYVIPIIVKSNDPAEERLEILRNIYNKYQSNPEFLSAFYWKGDDFLVIELDSKSLLIDEITKADFIGNSKPITTLRAFSNSFINRIIISYLTPNTIVKVHEANKDTYIGVIFSNNFQDDEIDKKISIKRLPRIDYAHLNSYSMKLQSRLNEIMIEKNKNYQPPKAQFNAGAYPDVTKKGTIMQNGEPTDIFIWDNRKFKDEFEIVKIPYRFIEINPTFSSSEITSCLPAEKTLVQNYIKSKNKKEQTTSSISPNFKEEEVIPPPPKVGQLVKFPKFKQNVIFMGFLNNHEIIYRPSQDIFTFNDINSLHDVNRIASHIIPIREINEYIKFKKDRLGTIVINDPYKDKLQDKCTQQMTNQFSYPVKSSIMTDYINDKTTGKEIRGPALEKLSISRKVAVYKYDLYPGDLVKLKNEDNIYAVYSVNDDFTCDLMKHGSTETERVPKASIECDQSNTPKIVKPSNNCLDSKQFRLMVHDKVIADGASWTILALHDGKSFLQTGDTMKWAESQYTVFEGSKPPSKKINTFVNRNIQTINNENYTIYEVDYDKGIFYCDKDHEISFKISDCGTKYLFT